MTIRVLGRSAGMETPAKRRALSILAVGGVAASRSPQAWWEAQAGWATRTRQPPRRSSPSHLATSSWNTRASTAGRGTLTHTRWKATWSSTHPSAASPWRTARSAPPCPQAAEAARPERDRDEHAGDRHRRTRHREALGHHALPGQGKALRSYDVSGDSAELLDEIELEGGSRHSASDRRRQGARHLGRLRQLARHLDRDRRRGRHLRSRCHVRGSQAGARRRQRERTAPGLDRSTRHPIPAPVPGPRPRDGPDRASAGAEGEGDAPTGATGETGPEPEADDEPEWLPQASLHDLDDRRERHRRRSPAATTSHTRMSSRASACSRC